jgi:hypothetical protein
MITGHHPLVPANFMLGFCLNISIKMVFAKVLPGVFLEKNRTPPALVALHSSNPFFIWTIKDV